MNALVIGGAFEMEGGPQAQERHLVAWFEAEVLRGPGAFWNLVDGYDDFARAMSAKLLHELSLPMVGGSPAPEPRG